MKKTKQQLFIVLFLLTIFSCSKDSEMDNTNLLAEQNHVDLIQIKKIAGEMLFETSNTSIKSNVPNAKSLKKTIKDINEAKNEYGNTSFYVINYIEGGFILLSADKRTEPILGFSEKGNFILNENSFPPGLKFWVKNTKKQITDIQNSNIEQSENNKIAWEQVQFQLSTSQLSAIAPPGDECFDHTVTITKGPLLSTTWHQLGVFNDALPYINCSGSSFQVYAGCVPIAMAQVMKYYEHPSTYSWSSMPLTYGTTTTANFIADIHNAIDYMYGSYSPSSPVYTCNSTGVYTSHDMSNVLKTQFNYSYATTANYDYNTVKSNIGNGKPVILSGNDGGSEGHMWVCDGYRQTYFYFADCTGGSFYPLFHMNWGWIDGSYNGYYSYNDFTPGSFNFNYNKKMIYNIIP
ncbi:C10 family peptidase [Lutibacter sp. B1]|uniref:C10 family peptidase n=1 Tax=Lutibacter sp. B1 TaxID=2725996 RepID=UPI0014565FE4|nr:C10 family peptidase [Lutibacter sp. B1]NLP59420.1 hypothetical protein [Lutibacter sp. B1]